MDTATDTRSATGRIELHASPEAVWKALTDAAELVRWFPLEARVEPGEGGSIFMSWKNEHDDRDHERDSPIRQTQPRQHDIRRLDHAERHDAVDPGHLEHVPALQLSEEFLVGLHRGVLCGVRPSRLTSFSASR